MFNSNLKQYKYFLYARKSSESEDRQVQSIDDQIMFLTKKYPHAQIIHTFKESRSAKIRNNRPEFNEMIERVEAGEVDGIICWELNRLSRNAEEAGIIMGLLQRFQLKQILTYDKSYLPEDNVLLMFVEFGISTQYSKDLSKNVKRGFQGKYERGEFPHLARVGYINNKEDHTIDPDPERFEIVREMWNLLLKKKYNVAQIHKIVHEEWKFRTRTMKRQGGKPMSLSMMHRMFSNIFYAGYFYDDKGEHQPMITLEEFDLAQKFLGENGKPRPKKHIHSYTGFIKCAECGCSVTGEKKLKFIKKTGEFKYYTYYHCTWKKPGYKCTQKKSIEESKMDKEIHRMLKKVKIC